MTRDDLKRTLDVDCLPRSSKYDPEWMIRNEMGPNAVWLTESLTQAMDLRPGMKVLDMGCGRAMSSIFLAKEFGVQVWATDLWIKPTDNWARVREAGVESLVYPVYAEAHALPYAEEFFDAAVSLDSYHYYGTSERYLLSFAKLVKRGGQIGIVVPGFTKEFDDEIPENLRPVWDAELYTFHSPEWWARLWTRSDMVDVEVADLLPDGWRLWLRWEEVCEASGFRRREGDTGFLLADGGEYLGLTRVVARRK